MPWKVAKHADCPSDKPWGVINTETGDKRGCHVSRADAIQQMRALYANVPEARRMSEENEMLSYLAPIHKQFGDAVAGDMTAKWIDGNKLWIHVLPYDSWDHPMFGETTVTRDIASSLKKNFDENVKGVEIPTDYEHGMDKARGAKASGWFRELDARDDGLYGLVEFTDTAKEEIEKGEWRYFSADYWDTWTHPHNGTTYAYVLNGGGLTNKPWVKKMLPLNFSEVIIEDSTIEKEHSEPGTDGEELDPIVTPPDDGGYPDRFDTPPDPAGTNDKGGEFVVDEKAIREALGLADDGDILTTIQGIKTKADSFDAIGEDVSRAKKFSEQFPDEHRRMERLEAENREVTARRFSEEIASMRLSIAEGENKKDTGKGLSALALQKVEETAKKFSEGTAALTDYRETIEAILDDGIVDYGTTGSSRTPDEPDTDTSVSGNHQENRRKFSELVNSIIKEDNLDMKAALAEAGKRAPELFAAYKQPPVVQSQ